MHRDVCGGVDDSGSFDGIATSAGCFLPGIRSCILNYLFVVSSDLHLIEARPQERGGDRLAGWLAGFANPQPAGTLLELTINTFGRVLLLVGQALPRT